MKLAVLVPVFNEESNIPPFYERIRPILKSLEGLDRCDLVFINDGSRDGTLARILELRGKDPGVQVITLARNFGYTAGLLAGLSRVESDLYAIIDVDCEDPPELLSQFYEAIQQGAQVVYGVRSQREEKSWVTWFRALFYYVNNWIADSPTILWMAEFVMMTRQVRDALLVSRTTYPFLRAEIAHIGYKAVGISYQRAQRTIGKSHYNFLQMTRFAVAGFLASSTFPLRAILYVATGIGLAFPVAAQVFKLSLSQSSDISSILLLYFSLFTLPMLALYLARTYKNGVARPVFTIDHKQTHLR